MRTRPHVPDLSAAWHALTDWVVRWVHLPGETLGETHWHIREVWLDPRQFADEERSTIAHEAWHVRRGPAAPGYEAREERIVEGLAARELITIDQLADALVWAYDVHELAEELQVDVWLALARLENLTAEEGRELEHRLDNAESRFSSRQPVDPGLGWAGRC